MEALRTASEPWRWIWTFLMPYHDATEVKQIFSTEFTEPDKVVGMIKDLSKTFDCIQCISLIANYMPKASSTKH